MPLLDPAPRFPGCGEAPEALDDVGLDTTVVLVPDAPVRHSEFVGVEDTEQFVTTELAQDGTYRGAESLSLILESCWIHSLEL